MSANEDLANWEIFVWALNELGGGNTMIDVEEVFIRCFEIAPRRFCWRTRPALPDYKKCSKALSDAEARRPALLIKTGDTFGRQLTVAGQQWVDSNDHRLRPLLGFGRNISEPRQRPRSKMLAEVERSEIFQQWKQHFSFQAEKWRVADLLRCSPDSSHRIWSDRLQTLRSAAYAAKKSEVLSFLDSLQKSNPDWFGGSHEA
jgi:hypothetical protein